MPARRFWLINCAPFPHPGSPLASSEYPDLGGIRRVLVTKLRHHGDVLLASPVIGALKRHLPDAEIDALVYRETRDMLEGHPDLTELHLVTKGGSLGEEWRLFQGLRARHYDLLVHLTTSSRGAWLARLLKPRVSVAPAHGGRFYQHSFSHLYPVVAGNRRHTVETNLDGLRRIGVWPEQEERRLVMNPGIAAEEKADALLAELGLTPGGYVLIHPTSRWLFKCWPEEKVAELATELSANGHPTLFTCAPDPRELAMLERIRARMAPPPPSLAGKLSLKELAALIGRARLFIGVDSAPMHMAAAMGTPTVAMFGPSGEIDWGPWMVESRVLTSNHSCRPCGQDGCGGGKRSECLEVISTRRVLDAALELLEQSR
jgi:heptosyltransferase-3